MNSRCIIVIGHVDHGKTALVRALTGMETDHTAEEKARGLSMVAGFAHKTFPNGTADFIDAPGHEDYIAAMVGAASGAQAALLVISATEGISPQTTEHLNIVALLGITHAVIAVTKSDLLSPEAIPQALGNLRAGLSGSVFADAPMVPCSAHTQDGLPALEGALSELIGCPPPQHRLTHAVLPIDRVFTREGFGTVVTGSLLGAGLQVGTAATVQPAGHAVHLRALQSRGEECNTVQAGTRVAVNLRGVSVSDVARGDVLVTGGSAATSDCVDVEISAAHGPLKHMQQVRLLIGTTQVIGSVRLFGNKQMDADSSALAQIRLNRPISAYAGQRAVLRTLSPPNTIGGALVLDPKALPTRAGDRNRPPLLRAIKTRDPRSISLAVCAAQRGIAAMTEVARLSALSEVEVCARITPSFQHIGQGWYASSETINACCRDILSALTDFHAAHPRQAKAPRDAIILRGTAPPLHDYAENLLIERGDILRQHGSLAIASHDPIALLSESDHAAMNALDTQYSDAGLAPLPLPDNTEHRELMGLLLHRGVILALPNIALKQTLYLHEQTLVDALKTLQAAFTAPQSFTTSQARNALGTSRRIVVPVLEHFDKEGITLRTGDIRTLADNLPVPPAPNGS